MKHIADIRFVHTHAKRDGGAHHHPVALDEFVLPETAGLGVQTRMIGEGIDILGLQFGGDVVTGLAAGAVDDAGAIRARLDEINNLGGAGSPGPHSQMQVGAIKPRDEFVRRLFK